MINLKKKSIYKLSFILLPFILAIPFHFLYEYIPFPLFATYLPVNESVFEHTKLTFTPIIITFIIFSILRRKNINTERALSSLIISISVSLVTMLTTYYIYHIFTDKDLTLINILSLLISTSLGQLLSIYTYKKGIKWSKEISIYSLLTMTVIFLIFTVNPPLLPFFYDKMSGVYGINNQFTK